MSTVSLFDNNDMRSAYVKTNFYRQIPYSISFQCSRSYPHGTDTSKIYIRSEIIFNIFKKAVEGKSDEDIKANDCAACIGADMGHCGNIRGDLAECRCEDLNRKIKPHIRNHFENKVIEKILGHNKIKQSFNNGKSFQFNLAIFCSGRLLGEEILLFRLLNKLHNLKASGTINLFLIDRMEYTPAIKVGDPLKTLSQCKYLDQFLREICECLPPTLKINGTIFAEAEHYIAQAEKDIQFRHDLLIGADIEGTQKIMSDISLKASVATGQTPLALVRSVEKGPPGCCEVVAGQLTNCFLYIDLPQRNPSEQSLSWVAPVAMVVAVIALILLASADNNRRM